MEVSPASSATCSSLHSKEVMRFCHVWSTVRWLERCEQPMMSISGLTSGKCLPPHTFSAAGGCADGSITTTMHLQLLDRPNLARSRALSRLTSSRVLTT